MNRLPWRVAVVVMAGLAWAFPPFHVRSMKGTRDALPQTQSSTDANDFVATFWRDTLLPAAGRATDAAEVVRAIADDPKHVRRRFGRTVGLSSSFFLFVRGSGRVATADAEAIGLAVTPDGNQPDVVVPLGFVFGNCLRDGTGLLDAGRYANAQEFNDLSARLNERVERDVLPEFQRVAKLGRRVAFAGCVEVGDEETDLKPLKLVPVYVRPE